jgi:hypothetical protein
MKHDIEKLAEKIQNKVCEIDPDGTNKDMTEIYLWAEDIIFNIKDYERIRMDSMIKKYEE